MYSKFSKYVPLENMWICVQLMCTSFESGSGRKPSFHSKRDTGIIKASQRVCCFLKPRGREWMVHWSINDCLGGLLRSLLRFCSRWDVRADMFLEFILTRYFLTICDHYWPSSLWGLMYSAFYLPRWKLFSLNILSTVIFSPLVHGRNIPKFFIVWISDSTSCLPHQGLIGIVLYTQWFWHHNYRVW